MARPVTSPPAPAAFDPWSDEFVRDPPAALRAAGAEAPVFYHPPLDMWIVTRYRDVERCLPDYRALSHKILGATPVPPEVRGRIQDGFFADSWISLDPPEHTIPRQVAQRGFTRPRIEALEPRIEALAHRLIDEFASDGAADLMTDYCYALTYGTMLELFDLDESWLPLIRGVAKDHIKVINTLVDPMPEAERAEVWRRYADAWDALRPVVDERSLRPTGDIVSLLANAVDERGRRVLTRDRVVLHLCEFAFAGTDTTANLMAAAIVLLSENPEQLQLVAGAASLWPAVVEETLRRRPPVSLVTRRAMRDLEFDGVVVPERSRVWLGLAGAAADPAKYDAPERFTIRRPKPDDHLSFGKGRHFCMGAPLARAQARIGLQALYHRLPTVRVLPGQELAFVNELGAPSRHTLRCEWRVTP